VYIRRSRLLMMFSYGVMVCSVAAPDLAVCLISALYSVLGSLLA
jgi:hypothetical protein